MRLNDPGFEEGHSIPPAAGRRRPAASAACTHGRTFAASGSVETHLGIPFAAAPVGARRFRAPIREEPWAEAQDATLFGPAMPQNPDAVMAAFGIHPPPISESDLGTSAVEGAQRAAQQ